MGERGGDRGGRDKERERESGYRDGEIEEGRDR